MPVAHLNGTELFYVEVGEGVPCLVMHGGLGGDHSALHPWLDPLGDVMQLVYYDHRGNGRSGRPPSGMITFERLCADADALREQLGFEKVAVLGHSYGGFVALEYALRYRERLSRLILLGTSPTEWRSRPTPGARARHRNNWRRWRLRRRTKPSTGACGSSLSRCTSTPSTRISQSACWAKGSSASRRQRRAMPS